MILLIQIAVGSMLKEVARSIVKVDEEGIMKLKVILTMARRREHRRSTRKAEDMTVEVMILLLMTRPIPTMARRRAEFLRNSRKAEDLVIVMILLLMMRMMLAWLICIRKLRNTRNLVQGMTLMIILVLMIVGMVTAVDMGMVAESVKVIVNLISTK
jgi:hypothetical protein